MAGKLSAKKLLAEYNSKCYRQFIVNDDLELILPQPSQVPWIGASRRRDTYRKTYSHQGNDHHIKFITKNESPYAFLWKTDAKKLVEAVRWGIIRPNSITGSVIATLGHYRVLTHERVVKGMVSNRQATKLQLLDLYQDRFTALQPLESMVNKELPLSAVQDILRVYSGELEKIKSNLSYYLPEIGDSSVNTTILQKIKSDIDQDIQKTHDYINLLEQPSYVESVLKARGPASIITYVKQQMINGLYELQGLNQDITYDNQQGFALTRGIFNDLIEDARKEIDDHQPDLQNIVTDKHHGIFSDHSSQPITYDFEVEQLNPAREREILMAISFIENWDSLHAEAGGGFSISNGRSSQPLSTIAATYWRTHLSWRALLHSMTSFVINFFKGMIIPTQPWDEEPWNDPDFHLVCTELKRHARPNEPLWQKPFRFFKRIIYIFIDIFKGVRDIGSRLVFKMPDQLINDWECTSELEELQDTLSNATLKINTMNSHHESLMNDLLRQCEFISDQNIGVATSHLAHIDYELTPGPQNDVLTVMARALNGVCSFFSHTIYAKDPLAGLIFTSAYGLGASAIFLPTQTAMFTGSDYVQKFSVFAYSLASSQWGAAVAGSSSQAQCAAIIWDSLMRGPNGRAFTAAHKFGQDPLTISAYFASAYTLGYFLVNGVSGHQIPWLSEHLRADLGALPETGYPIIGGKFAIVLYEGLLAEYKDQLPFQLLPGQAPSLQSAERVDNQRVINRLLLAIWLSKHANELPKLDSLQLVMLSRQIDDLFDRKESRSLHKLLYPERKLSIAFQLFSSPLAYIPRLLRLLASPGVAFLAFLCQKSKPFEPIKRAYTDLIERIKSDLSCLIIFASYMLNIPYMMVSSLLKITAYIGIMLISRIALLVSGSPSHRLHKAIAAVHRWSKNVSEYLFPATILENVACAHPVHTLRQVESSYAKLSRKINSQQVVATHLVSASQQSEQSSPVALVDSIISEQATPDSVMDSDHLVEISLPVLVPVVS
ncbi:MAG: hypothetical protein ACOVQX_03340 [Legionella sp.]